MTWISCRVIGRKLKEIISGKDNKSAFYYNFKGCEAKNTLFFRTDYYELYGLYWNRDNLQCI
jgi:hypothetical protein